MENSFNITNLTHHSSGEMPEAWSAEDYKKLLDTLGFEPTGNATENVEMTLLALADLEPTEAAVVLLTHSLSEELSEGQIEQVANDMQNDKIFEEYPEIHLHHRLFAINQVLRKAYNGKFPSGEVVSIKFDMTPTGKEKVAKADITPEVLLKCLTNAMPDSSLIKRLFPDELAGEKAFDDADSIVWRSEITESEDSFKVSMLSSDYWLGDLLDADGDYTADVKVFEAEEEE